MKSIVTAAVGIAFALIAVEASAQDMGDAKKGGDFARMVCAECHAVNADQTRSPNAKAPAFAAVSKTSGMTEMALRTWLQTSHPTMPNLVLKVEERDDVVAYILSLKGGKPRVGL